MFFIPGSKVKVLGGGCGGGEGEGIWGVVNRPPIWAQATGALPHTMATTHSIKKSSIIRFNILTPCRGFYQYRR
jgi:hypothetical protein